MNKKTRNTILLITLSLISVVLLTVGSFVVKKNDYEETFLKTINVWEGDLATAFIRSDQQFLQKISIGLFSLGPEKIRVNAKGITWLTYPIETDSNKCEISFIKNIDRYSQNLGSIQTCFSRLNILKAAISSPIFILAIFFITFMACIFSIIPLLSYKSALLKTIQALRKWQDDGEFQIDHVTTSSTHSKTDEIKNELLGIIQKQMELQKNQDEMKRMESLAQTASQVSHDIRSPLAALDMAIKEANELPEDLRLIIRSSVSRIRDIANNLLSKNRAQKSGEAEVAQEKKIETILLSSAIESLVSEKRMQFRSKLGVQIDFDITTESYGLFSKVELREFKRILSNLINNSVEALKEGGNVRVALTSAQDKVEIKVSDNGKGIPPEILSKIGQKGETFGKAEGNGLGLYHARTTLESWGGGLKFESTVGVGTTIIITLLKSEAPSWFVRELKFKSDSRIVVIDDDSSIHQIWDGRFQSSIPADAKIEVVHLSTPELAREWFKENGNNKATTYLVDFEFLGSDSNGLKLISELGIEKDSHLVTSRYEEEHILKKCLESNIPLIPKNLSAFVPIKVSGPADYVEYVYIEDDMLLRMGWERVAKKKKIKLLTLESPRKFENHLDKIDPETTQIYIDSSLGENEMKGEDFAKVLHDKGYKNLFIATGYEKERFAHLRWLKHSGKDCPFDDEE